MEAVLSVYVNVDQRNRELPWSEKLSWLGRVQPVSLTWSLGGSTLEAPLFEGIAGNIIRRQSRVKHETIGELPISDEVSHALILNNPISDTIFERLREQLDDRHPVVAFQPTIPYSLRTDVVAEVIDLEGYRRYLSSLPLSSKMRRQLGEFIRSHRDDFEALAGMIGAEKYLRDAYVKTFVTMKRKGELYAFTLTAEEIPTLAEFHKSFSEKIAPGVPPPPDTEASPVREDWGTGEDHAEYFVDRIAEFYPFPAVVSVLISNRCNLRCPVCPIWGPGIASTRTTDYYDEKKFMTEALFEKIASEVGVHNAIIKIGNIEEPLLHPKIIDFVKIANKYGARIHFTSNGTMMTKDRARALLEAGLSSVFFSLDAVTADVYSKVRGWKFDNVKQKVLDFIELRDTINPDVTVKTAFILQDLAWKQVDAFVDFWVERADGVIVYVLSENEKGINFARHTFLPLPDKRHSCPSPWSDFYVIPEGDVLTCCEADLQLSWKGVVSMGNVRDDTIESIWQRGHAYRDLRRRHIANKFDNLPKLCQDCTIWGSNISTRARWNNREGLLNPWCCEITKT